MKAKQGRDAVIQLLLSEDPAVKLQKIVKNTYRPVILRVKHTEISAL